jgi:hypothetical protein
MISDGVEQGIYYLVKVGEMIVYFYHLTFVVLFMVVVIIVCSLDLEVYTYFI